MSRPRAFAAPVLLLFTSCIGGSLGEHAPGDFGYVEQGGLAVDPVTERTFVMWSGGARDAGVSTSSRDAGPDGGALGFGTPLDGGPLFAIEPDTGAVRRVADLTGLGNVRVLFSDVGPLVFAQNGDEQQVRRFDPDSFAESGRLTNRAQYNGTRVSSSRRFVAATDDAAPDHPIHVVDAHDLTERVIPHGGDWLEAMWTHGRDRLLAVVSYDAGQPTNRMRILSWDLPALAAMGYPIGDDVWAHPDLDLSLPDETYDGEFAYTWIGVSPDDATLVFPLVAAPMGVPTTPQLVVLDAATGAIRTVDDAAGPVGFTPDGSTIVSYRLITHPSDAGTLLTSQLLLIDARTLDVQTLDVPLMGLPQYFVTREGHYVAVQATGDGGHVAVFDLDMHASVTLPAPRGGIENFVSRLGHDELWMVAGGLWRLDFAHDVSEYVPTRTGYQANLSSVAVEWQPANLNILPQHDLLVLDDVASPVVRFFDPNARTVARAVRLPVSP